ncbi:MAG TPA: SusC/RagA family TonB-linked outer membrane protein [Parapedobacter sp.]|nr:SusC/RagA family TonB-linked outer membrane protein [Parapedobacter sp.]
MYKNTLLILMLCFAVNAAVGQRAIMGRILSASDHKSLDGVNVRSMMLGHTTVTDADGIFEVRISPEPDTLQISFMGYETQYIPVGVNSNIDTLKIFLSQDATTLDEVVINTGYYEMMKERTTGSFTHVDNELFNRRVGPNVLQRLEGIAPGVQFVNAGGTSASDIRIRGVATIESDASPLIIVDNFPYERDINTINPNDVESITVLRDAAAASIWGARAGNGVIVITTKQGRYSQKAQITVNSNLTLGTTPDLHYSQRWLPSTTVMAIEKELFKKEHYAELPQTPIPAYVELLIKQRDGLIGITDFENEEQLMQRTDVRDEASRYLYQGELLQQHALTINGGGDNYRYYFSAGYDENRGVLVGDDSQRLNISLKNIFMPLRGLEVSTGIWYTQRQTKNKGISLGDLSPRAGYPVSPYTRLGDADDNPLAIPYERRLAYYDTATDIGLLDWHYRPLDELRNSDPVSLNTEYRLDVGLKYAFLNDLDLMVAYQYLRPTATGQTYYSPDSYYVRNLVNRFTQSDGSKIVPHGGILVGSGPSTNNTHSGRFQLNYNKHISTDHHVSALVGGEIRQSIGQGFPGYIKYNYDDELLTGTATFDYTTSYPTNPTGSGRLTAPRVTMSHYTDRFLSYFGNAVYTAMERYTVSGSWRWDGSNLFGVKANQRGVPLWSVGASWQINKEAFYKQESWLPYLRLRASYGHTGNVNKRVSVFPTVSYSTDGTTNLPTARVRSVGNPSLRWEKVAIVNIGADFGFFNNRIEGSIEYFRKQASDLIGEDYLAPSTGINDWVSLANEINYANLKTRGLDIQLTSRNTVGKVGWQTDVLFSYVSNEITHFNTGEVSSISSYFSAPPPVIGKSRDVVYAYPWIGLDHATGMPLVNVDGEVTMDYEAYIRNFNADNLLVSGVHVPPFYGAVRNTFRWGNLQAGINITWKAGYVFRRQSISPGEEYANTYHMDYFKRWEKPGDERNTDVPARSDVIKPYLNQSYMYSKALITEGDHVRLQDINISYALNKDLIRGLPVQHIRLYGYARNLGVLWRANKNEIDPDFLNAEYPTPKTFALGIRITL